MFFFVSRGKGFWILGSLFIAFPVAEGLARLVDPQTHPHWPIITSLIAAGLVSLGLGVHSALSSPRLVLERQTGRERMLRPIHSVYGLRAEYWGLLYLWTAWMATYHGAH